MAIANGPAYKDFGGHKLAVQVTTAFNAQKHLEANSFSAISGPNMVWLGIMNYLEMYEDNYIPLISMDEMTKNTVYIDGNQSSFLYGQPYKLGCPFIKEVLCDKTKLGFDNSTFHMVLSENIYTYNDILSTDRRFGKGIRVVPEKEGGEDAKIVPYNGGWRLLFEMASKDPAEYISHSEVMPGTEIERVDFSGGDEFRTESTSYTGNLMSSGSNRYGMDFYQFNVGVSDLSISYLITADASLKKVGMMSAIPQMNGMPKEAETDVINFFSKEQVKGVDERGRTKLSGVQMWIPKFIVNLGRELKDLQEVKLMYSTGWSRDNGREKLYGGLGLYHQIKAKGNHFYYQTARQGFDLIKNMLVSLYSGKYNIPMSERFIDIELGDGAYEMIQPFFQQYFNSDNKIVFDGNHDAYKDVLKKGPDGKLIYKPMEFGAVWYPNFGWIKIKRNPSLAMLDSYKKDQRYIGKYPESAYMIFVKDVTNKTFTGAELKGLKVPANGGNMLYIKKDSVPDSMEFTIGSGYIAPALLSAVGANANGGHSRDTSFNGLKVTLRTHGEVFLQDASRMVIAEYDPTGEREQVERSVVKAPLF
jgi:hypothetical protein